MAVTNDVISASALELTELAAEIIESGGTVEFASRGSSMKPMLTFDKSTVRLAAPGETHRGDVVLYRYPDGKCIMHRVVKVTGDGTFICRGDNNIWTEPGIRAGWIVAKVTDFTFRGKWVSVQSPAYKAYWHIWLFLWPIRKTAMRFWRKLKILANKGLNQKRDCL